MAIIELVSAAVYGSLKVALKKAAKQAAINLLGGSVPPAVARAIGSGEALAGLREISNKGIDDAATALLTRLKVRSDSALLEYTARHMGISKGQVKAILHYFNPTPKQRQAGLAKNFIRLANKQLTKNLKLGKLTGAKAARITDIIKAARKEIEGVLNDGEEPPQSPGIDTPPDDTQDIINQHVAERLQAIENALRERIEGAYGVIDAHQKPMQFFYGVADLYQIGDDYTRATVQQLDDILDNTYDDIENYDYGSGDEVALIGDEAGDWQVTSRKNVEAFIKDRYDDAKWVLNNTKKV